VRRRLLPFCIIFILLLASLIEIFSSDVINVTALNDPTQPPDGGTVYVNGDWEVTDVRYYYNCTIVMNGSIIVKNGGSLTLRNVTIIMNNTFNGTFNIEVLSGGSCYIYDFDNLSSTDFDRSKVTSANPDYHYMFWVRDGANFIMKNSEMHECGWNSGSNQGLTIESDWVVIDNNIITNSKEGVRLSYSSNCAITNNTISNCNPGFIAWYSSGNTIVNNSFLNNSFGIRIYYSSDNTLAYNDVSNCHDGIYLFDAPRTIITNNSIYSNILYGIDMWASENTNITDNTISNNEYGIVLRKTSPNCIISGNTLSSNEDGGFALQSSSNSITNNTIISNKRRGINAYSSSMNIILNNAISDNHVGIFFDTSSDNTICNNTISNNWMGFSHYSSNTNIIRNNSFLGNAFYAISSGSVIDVQYNYWGTTDLSKIDRMIQNVDYNNPLDSSPSGVDIEFITGNVNWNGTLNVEKGVIVDGSLLINNANIFFNNTKGQNFIQVNTDMKINDSNIHSNFGNYTFLYTNNSLGDMTNSSLTHQRSVTLQTNNKTITNNEFNRGSYGIICMKSSTNNTITDNNITFCKWEGIVLSYSPSNQICDNNISGNWMGVNLDYSPNIRIENNTFLSNEQGGIYSWDSPDLTITNNIISWNKNTGLYLRYSSGSTINKNIIHSNPSIGLLISYPGDNIITHNEISNNGKGIYLHFTTDNIIRNNNISSNFNYNFYLENSRYNLIYHNNILNLSIQAYDNRDDNYWDNGYPLGGNYWSDYNGVDNFKGPNQDQPGSDGIGDTNYSIDGDSVDHYPLMGPYYGRQLKNYSVLKEGWNLISIPLIQEHQNLEKVLEMIAGYYDAVQWYNISDINDHWKHNKMGKIFGNDLFHLNESIGFWIHITQSGDTIFIFNGTQPIVNLTIDLFPGWNLVGYPSTISYNRTDALNNIDFGTDVDAIWTYNATTQKWKEITASDNFEVSRGYWIHSKVTKTWIVPL
jgi:parallel beta-helix repeat protein